MTFASNTGRLTVTTDTSERTHIPAAENVWYNLLTIAGEVPPESRIEDLENRKKIIAANRRYWNGYFHRYLEKEERSHFVDSLPTLDDKELAHIYDVMADRGFDSLPIDVSTVELVFVDAGVMDLVLEGFGFKSLNCIAFRTRASIELNRAKIDYLVDFAEAKVYGNMNFMGAKIDVSINLEQVEIGGRISFDRAHIGGSIKFRHTSAKGLNLKYVTCGHTDFTDALFDGPCSFVGTQFNEVPIFFGTQLHEDTN